MHDLAIAAKIAFMRSEFRAGLFVGIAAAVAIALYCAWLWQGERQVARQTQKLFHAIEAKNWSAVGDFIADDYRDQWNQDRALVLERMRMVLGFGRKFQINAADVDCKIDNAVGVWRGKVSIVSDDAEMGAMVKERVNSLRTPFELRWRHVSSKPSDWKLIRVSNSELEIPAGFE
ncbi:MAG: hypothetical protein DME57_02330 [Verrucomicrobia bacterium]|nr:MAG: hypothetical protein DME57_02330 [Verrucomicrobiota bacterium]